MSRIDVMFTPGQPYLLLSPRMVRVQTPFHR